MERRIAGGLGGSAQRPQPAQAAQESRDHRADGPPQQNGYLIAREMSTESQRAHRAPARLVRGAVAASDPAAMPAMESCTDLCTRPHDCTSEVNADGQLHGSDSVCFLSFTSWVAMSTCLPVGCSVRASRCRA